MSSSDNSDEEIEEDDFIWKCFGKKSNIAFAFYAGAVCADLLSKDKKLTPKLKKKLLELKKISQRD